MTKRQTFLLDSALFAKIQAAINSGWVSVYIDPDGMMREYTVFMPDDSLLCMTMEVSYDCCNYIISIDEEDIANVVVPGANKNADPVRDAVLKLFKICSSKVIWQEMNGQLMHMLSGKTRKMYS